ncbi:MAG: (deoxy)nucleoside triphosphate pyrophosphohydrolase [Chlamydiae bacterium]|nr:(deoxy)nucleoside triphosphate pyrophosphohydrolase [Chlamydiota bacterium]MBI3266608.1 (deoxy)nucleoside triphosphate pyrophosphohydrolase [Chlamydiota bacterium]
MIEVCAALIEENGKYLVAQRLPCAKHLPLYWEFPGGKRENGESLEECLKREIFEELDVEIEGGALLGQWSYHYSDRQVVLYFYEASIVSGKLHKKDCHDFKWLRPDEMEYDVFPPADVPVIQRLREKIKR